MDRFFLVTTCDRCHTDLGKVRTTSWFTEETICMDCSKQESEMKMTLRKKHGHSFEGCGYVPVKEATI